jgi:hypothetical protein
MPHEEIYQSDNSRLPSHQTSIHHTNVHPTAHQSARHSAENSEVNIEERSVPNSTPNDMTSEIVIKGMVTLTSEQERVPQVKESYS